VNYDKLDSALAGALTAGQSSPGGRLSVFIRTELNLPATASRLLEAYGIGAAMESAPLLSLDLSPAQIEELSEQPWVKFIRLARNARPLTSNSL